MMKSYMFFVFVLTTLLVAATVHAQFYDPNYNSQQNYNNNHYAGYNTNSYNGYQQGGNFNTNSFNSGGQQGNFNTNQNTAGNVNPTAGSGSSFQNTANSAGYNTQYGYNGGSNYYQAANPNGGYSGFNTGFQSQYWPQLQGGFQNAGACTQVRTDFLMQIPPGGCTPNVVRSDLLAEQNVPVFCRLSTLKLNPLIDASAIQSITFSGEYPQGIAGISYHPAREGIRSYNTVLSGPATDEAGYIVISLTRQPDERNLPKFLEGNLTAQIRYDSRQLIGTSHAEYYLEAKDGKVPFWHGRGFLEVESVDRGTARVNVYTDLNSEPYQTLTLAEGQSGGTIFFPGSYCTGGAQVRLNRVVAPEDMALLNIEGDQIWVRKGSRFNNNLCQVTRLDVFGGGSGSMDISCAGKRFTLQLFDRGVTLNNGGTLQEYRVGSSIVRGSETYYLSYYGTSPDGQDFVVLTKKKLDSLDLAFINDHFERNWDNVNRPVFDASLGDSKEGAQRIGKLDSDYFMLYTQTEDSSGSSLNGLAFNTIDSQHQNIDTYGVAHEIITGSNTARELVDFYPTEVKVDGTFWGEEALYQQILLTGQAGHISTQMELISLFEERYPASPFLSNVLSIRQQRSLLDTSDSHASVQVNNEFFNIFVDRFRAESDLDKAATIRIGGQNARFVRQNEEIEFDNGKLVVQDIKVNGVDFTFESLEGSSQGQFIRNEGFGQLGGREIEVRETNTREVAYLSVVPQVNNNQFSEANFAFKIGIEDRNIELNPERAQGAIDNLNASIARWEQILDTLGGVIKVWKAVCFSTSTLLSLQTMLDGFDGESLARNKVMSKYKTICDQEISKGTYSTRTECYNALSGQVDSDVNTMKDAINSVNSQMKQAQQGNTQTSGLLGKESVVNQEKYVSDLKRTLNWQGVEIDGVQVTTEDLTKSTEIRSVLLYQTLNCNVDQNICSNNLQSNIACCSAYDEMKGNLGSAILQKKNNQQSKIVSDKLEQVTGGYRPQVVIVENPDAARAIWGGETGRVLGGKKPAGILDTDKIAFVDIEDGNSYLVKLKDATLGGSMGVESAYILDGSNNWVQVKDLAGSKVGKMVFAGGSKNACEGNTIKNPEVRYYESGRNKGLPSIVPFDISNGWYAYVPNSQGSILEGTLKTYSAAGDVNFFWICNAGKNRIVEQKSGDDLCQSFSANQVGFDTFISCGLQGAEVGKLYSQARNAITQAAQGYGQSNVNINGQTLRNGEPVSDTGGAECQDFMSPDNCRMLFNACDPVICPSSRCDLGGKYPVADVIQTGIVGSIALCLPNAKEGVIFPVCLTGIHAGIDSFVSILKSERECLQHNLNTGEYIGICDEITAVYMCEFFWRQFGSVLDVILPSFLEYSFGTPTTRGGGEYLNVQASLDNAQKSAEFFTGFYAENAFRSFSLNNAQNIGVEMCNGFLGSSVPLGLSAEGFDALLSPESPTQFYAYFSEVPFTDATSPATSHYKVYYHIYAGNDFGASYQVYLKSPAAGGRFAVSPVANVRTGFAPRGEAADESIDFTAPSGYKELCVRINNQEHCGFGSVTSNFALNYASEKYTEDQATQTDITTEEACVSTSPSAWGFVAPNIQAGAETAIGGRDINLAGITRVCASSNPEAGIGQEDNLAACQSDQDCGSGYICNLQEGSQVGNCVDHNGLKKQSQGRWVDVGYCGDPNIRCWLDSSTLKDRFNAIDAVNQELLGVPGTVEDHLRYGQLFEETQQSYELARASLSEQYNKIRALTPANLRGGESDATIAQILFELEEFVGVFDPGQGTSNNKAEALALRATVYRLIVEQKMRDSAGVVSSGAPELLIDGSFGEAEVIGRPQIAPQADDGIEVLPNPNSDDGIETLPGGNIETLPGGNDNIETLPGGDVAPGVDLGDPLVVRNIGGRLTIFQGPVESNYYVLNNRILQKGVNGGNPLIVARIEEDGVVNVTLPNEDFLGGKTSSLSGFYYEEGFGFNPL